MATDLDAIKDEMSDLSARLDRVERAMSGFDDPQLAEAVKKAERDKALGLFGKDAIPIPKAAEHLRRDRFGN